MSTALTEDVEALRSGLAGDQSEIEMTLRLPRESAKQEFTATQAAKILGMSRPTLMWLMSVGRISFRRVGKHHRISAAAIQEFRERQGEEGDPMAVVAALANKYGNVD